MLRSAQVAPFSLLLVTIVCFTLCIAAGLDNALGATADDELQLALDALKQQTENVFSTDMKFNWIQWDPPEAAARSGFPAQTSKRVCRYITSGKKLRYEEELSFGEVKEPAAREVIVYDGMVYKKHEPYTKQGSIVTEAASPWSLLQLAYVVNKGDIAGFLAMHAQDIIPSIVHNDQGEQLLLLKITDGARDYEISLDPRVGYQPRIIYWRGTVPQRTAEATGVTSVEIRSDVLGYRTVDGFVFPNKARFTYDKHMANGEVKRETWRTVELQDIKVNLRIDEDQFTIDFPSGTRVTQYDVGITNVIP